MDSSGASLRFGGGDGPFAHVMEATGPSPPSQSTQTSHPWVWFQAARVLPADHLHMSPPIQGHIRGQDPLELPKAEHSSITEYNASNGSSSHRESVDP